jgi:hypothetical protein
VAVLLLQPNATEGKARQAAQTETRFRSSAHVRFRIIDPIAEWPKGTRSPKKEKPAEKTDAGIGRGDRVATGCGAAQTSVMSDPLPIVSSSSAADAWPSLPLDAWKPTRETLHMYAQIAGKVRLALAPMEPQWGQAPLYVTSRGLTTSPISYGDRTFSIAFDWVAHELAIETNDGEKRAFALAPRSVAAFYAELMGALRSLGIDVRVRPRPAEVPRAIPFPEDEVHASYDAEAVGRFFGVLSRVDAVLKRHRALFWGRTSPVSLYWGTFDLAYSRYSGRPATPPPGSDLIMRLAMNVETFEAGFWPGDERFPEPAFYAFLYPKPDGLEGDRVGPPGAFWSPELGEFLLRYEDVRRTSSPEVAIFEFLETTYRASAARAGWDLDAFDGPLLRAS